MTATTTIQHHTAPGYEIGPNAARLLGANIIQASPLAMLISVTLPQLSRLAAKGVIFRASQGRYLLAESVANYLAYKSAPRAYNYEEALAAARKEGVADPEATARVWSG
ncbi:MAG: hypothetical protein LBO05_04205 [Deltaproteobacteria bacterium]|jgi:hypothetical protein|nr:hypothetical protein [Deltaproteobacteria bacterium]